MNERRPMKEQANPQLVADLIKQYKIKYRGLPIATIKHLVLKAYGVKRNRIKS